MAKILSIKIGKVIKKDKKFELVPDESITVEAAAVAKVKDTDTASLLADLLKRVKKLENQ